MTANSCRLLCYGTLDSLFPRVVLSLSLSQITCGMCTAALSHICKFLYEMVIFNLSRRNIHVPVTHGYYGTQISINLLIRYVD